MKTTPTHEMVKDSYANMLRTAQEKPSCCGTTSPAAKLAGYEETEQHADAASASFGCGNPLAFAGVQSGDTVLDLGSGAGLDLLIAAEKTGSSGAVIGVDMTDDMIEVARNNARKAGYDNIEIRRGLIEALPVEDSSTDWVISNCVINLSPDKPKVFSEVFRVMKPGAQLSISDIVVQDLPDWIRESAAAWSACALSCRLRASSRSRCASLSPLRSLMDLSRRALSSSTRSRTPSSSGSNLRIVSYSRMALS